MNLSDIFEKNEWEYKNNYFQEATHGDITLYLSDNNLFIKYPSGNVSTSTDYKIIIKTQFDQKKILLLPKDHKYTMRDITKNLSEIHKNQEKIINVYKYLSVILKDEEYGEYLFICSDIDYLNINREIFNQIRHERSEKLIRKYGQLLNKIQKYIWEDQPEIFVPAKFLVDTYIRFCEKYKDRQHYSSGCVLDNFNFLPFMSEKQRKVYKQLTLKESEEPQNSHHQTLEIVFKMEEILKNY